MKTNNATERTQAAAMKRMSLVAVLALVTLMPAVAQRDGMSSEAVKDGSQDAPAVREGHRRAFAEGMKGKEECGHFSQGPQGKCHRCFEQGQKQNADEIALKKAKKIRHALKLDDKQYNDVYKIYQKTYKKLESGAFKGKKRDEMHAAHMSIDKQMAKVLNDVQYAEWKQLESRRGPRMPKQK